jgi:multiple sugar transport system permease protein
MAALLTPPALPAVRPVTPLGALVRRAASLLVVHAVLIAGAVFILLPFVWMLITSIKSPAEIFDATFTFWPRRFNAAQNYSYALTSAPLLRFMVNGVIVCGGILIVQILIAVPCAYALAKLRFPGSTLLLALVLMGLCIPIQVPALPLYMALANLGLLNSYFAIMMPFFISVFAIFLFRQFFKSYPDEIIYAARLDGMSEFEIVWSIVAPSAWPAIAAFSVFSIVAHWNDLYWPLIVISDTNLATPPLGMMFFASAETGSNYGALTAAATVITAPLVIAFLIARRRFIEGITMTGIK